jgi:zinc transporter ZupT
LGLSKGTFIYVSASDLVPELQHEARSTPVVVSMVAGFILVMALSLLMPAV